MTAAVRAVALTAQESLTTTVTTLLVAVGGLVVGLGLITNGQEAVLIATTTPAVALGFGVAAVIHTRTISPSALLAGVMALVVQIGADLVAFLPGWSSTVQLVIPVVSAVVLVVLQLLVALHAVKASLRIKGVL